jgi:hypothetical protein
MLFKHASKASFPSAASSVLNSNSWSIFRATMRMTLESSTIRQVFDLLISPYSSTPAVLLLERTKFPVWVH